MQPTQSIAESLARLSDLEAEYDNLEAEYDCTIRCLAVAVEQVQHLTGSTEMHIADTAVHDRPDLQAWRTPGQDYICLRTSR